MLLATPGLDLQYFVFFASFCRCQECLLGNIKWLNKLLAVTWLTVYRQLHIAVVHPLQWCKVGRGSV